MGCSTAMFPQLPGFSHQLELRGNSQSQSLCCACHADSRGWEEENKTRRRKLGAACEKWVTLGLTLSGHLLQVPLEKQMSGVYQDYY